MSLSTRRPHGSKQTLACLRTLTPPRSKSASDLSRTSTCLRTMHYRQTDATPTNRVLLFKCSLVSGPPAATRLAPRCSAFHFIRTKAPHHSYQSSWLYLRLLRRLCASSCSSCSRAASIIASIAAFSFSAPSSSCNFLMLFSIHRSSLP